MSKSEVEYLKTVEILTKALALSPNSHSTYFTLGSAYRELWLLDIEERSRTDMLSHKKLPNKERDVRTNTGFEYLDKALFNISKACEFSPKDVDKLMVLARIQINLRKEDEARLSMQRAVTIADENYAVISSLQEICGVKTGEEQRLPVLEETAWILDERAEYRCESCLQSVGQQGSCTTDESIT